MPPTYLTTTQPTSKILCYYVNSTHKLQMIRVVNGNSTSLEKVVFPRQRILFETRSQERLEVHSQGEGKPVPEAIFPCQNLQANRPQQELATI